MLAGATLACVLAAQPPAGIEFEVASIKPADPSAAAHMGQLMGNGFRGRSLRLFELIVSAWHVNGDQIIGGPNGMETDETHAAGQYAVNLSLAPVDPGGGDGQDPAPSIFQALQDSIARRSQIRTERLLSTLLIALT